MCKIVAPLYSNYDLKKLKYSKNVQPSGINVEMNKKIVWMLIF